MSGLSDHFSWEEAAQSATAQRDGIDNTIPQPLRVNITYTAGLAEVARSIIGVPMRITSWYRCPLLNARVGGSVNSKHMLGLAIDFIPVGMELVDAFDRLARAADLPFDQLIEERTKSGAAWIHLGFTRGTPRRDVFRARGSLANHMAYTRVAEG